MVDLDMTYQASKGTPPFPTETFSFSVFCFFGSACALKLKKSKRQNVFCMKRAKLFFSFEIFFEIIALISQTCNIAPWIFGSFYKKSSIQKHMHF
jgi:hypothetical protein